VCLWRRQPAASRATFTTSLSLRVGDAVAVTLPERYVLLGALLVYGVPLGALLGGAVLGVAATRTDLGGLAGAVIAVAAAVLVSPALRRRLEQQTLRQLAVQRMSSADADTHSL
jgi:positive regulator of sigma E activity